MTVAASPIANGERLALAGHAVVEPETLREEARRRVERGERLACLFAMPGPAAGEADLAALFADDRRGGLALGLAHVAGGGYPALTPAVPQAHAFEREIAELHGIVPRGHPRLEPLRALPGSTTDGRERRGFYRVDGEEVHEVAVGPVHAGVIEPGHFRFQCHGETVFHLDIALGYQHRGLVRALAGGPHRGTLAQIETIAGDTTIGHTWAYARLLEALGGTAASPRAEAIRAIALELERLANHVGGLGALAGDVAYPAAAARLGKLRGDYLNLTAASCGSRFGRGLVRPGGVGFDLDAALAAELGRRLAAAAASTERTLELLFQSASVRARFEGVGALDRLTCEELGLVGPVARACGAERDVRTCHPFGPERESRRPLALARSGDVAARAAVRRSEIAHSVAEVTEQLARLPPGELRAPLGELASESIAVALVEGWRGEICHVAVTDARGRFRAYQIVDPSFHNWHGLALAMRGGEISDFPLVNKSFDLSYCGHDL